MHNSVNSQVLFGSKGNKEIPWLVVEYEIQNWLCNFLTSLRIG